MVDHKRRWAPAALATAVLLTGIGLIATETAFADNCGNACRNAYNQCRIATKGSPSCEAQFTSCMQRCRSK